MAAHVEGFIEGQVAIGEVHGAPKEVCWHFNSRSPVTDEERAQDRDAQTVMKNITARTGLTVKIEQRKIKVLVVTKAGSGPILVARVRRPVKRLLSGRYGAKPLADPKEN